MINYHLANSAKNFDVLDFPPLSDSISFQASEIDLRFVDIISLGIFTILVRIFLLIN